MRTFPPLVTGSAIIGLRCPMCQRSFARGDVLYTLVSHTGPLDARVLDAALVHGHCDDPQGHLD